MGKLIKIAFRNIFRNVQRSVLSIIMIIIAVMVIVVGSSFLSGMLSNIAMESVRLTGNVRIISEDHDLKEKMMSLTGSVTDYSALKEEVSSVSNVKNVVGQIKFNSVLYKGEKTSQGYGYGIEEEAKDILQLEELTYEGRPFSTESKDEVLVGQNISEDLDLKIGDEITLVGRGGNNQSYSTTYKVVGLIDFNNTLLNGSFFLSLSSAQELLGMSNEATEILVFGQTQEDTDHIMKEIKALSGTKDFIIESWEDIGMGALLIGIVRIVSTIAQLILISLAAFGIANTIMMAVLERKGEIGLLKSMGMHEKEVITLFAIEGVIMGMIGIVIGLFIGGIGAFILSTKGLNLGSGLEGFSVKLGGVVYGGFTLKIFMKGFLFGMGATIIATLIPVFGVVRLKPSEALKN